MKVLSLFDGISIARQALKNLNIPVEAYYSSEIDKYAIQVSQKNFPDIIRLGDVQMVNGTDFKDLDLMIGGSPCQDLSIAKKDRKGLAGQRSGLFYEYVRILNEAKPKYFILENVNSMPKEAKLQISEILGVEPIMINAALVSAQNRKRLFWVGKLINGKYQTVSISLPEDRGIFLRDIIEGGVVDREKSLILTTRYAGFSGSQKYLESRYFGKSMGQAVFDKPDRLGEVGNSKSQGNRVYSTDGKSVALSANGGGMGAKTGLYLDDMIIRKLTPIECERLQSLPDNYTEGISNTQRYKTLGNGFNCAVIEHIYKTLFNL